MMRALGVLLLATLCGCTMHRSAPPDAGPAEVRIVRTGTRYALHVDGRPFVIKGAGLDGGDQEALAARGGNSFRTWRPGTARESGRAMLDRACRNGLYVALGIPMPAQRHGFQGRTVAELAAKLFG